MTAFCYTRGTHPSSPIRLPGKITWNPQTDQSGVNIMCSPPNRDPAARAFEENHSISVHVRQCSGLPRAKQRETPSNSPPQKKKDKNKEARETKARSSNCLQAEPGKVRYHVLTDFHPPTQPRPASVSSPSAAAEPRDPKRRSGQDRRGGAGAEDGAAGGAHARLGSSVESLSFQAIPWKFARETIKVLELLLVFETMWPLSQQTICLPGK